MSKHNRDRKQRAADNLPPVNRIPVNLADTVICLYRLAERLGVDLHQEIDNKMAVNRSRQWTNDGSGCGYHK